MAFEETNLSFGNAVKVTLVLGGSTETLLGGLDSYSIGEDTRVVENVPRVFSDGRLTSIIGEKNPQDITLGGFFLSDTDSTAWRVMRNYYENAENKDGEIGFDILRLYTDDGSGSGGIHYFTAAEGSYFKVTA